MNNYVMSTEEFLNFKSILQNLYLKCLEQNLTKNKIKDKINKKLDYFKEEGFFNYYEIKKVNKNNIQIIINIGNELYKIELMRG